MRTLSNVQNGVFCDSRSLFSQKSYIIYIWKSDKHTPESGVKTTRYNNRATTEIKGPWKFL